VWRRTPAQWQQVKCSEPKPLCVDLFERFEVCTCSAFLGPPGVYRHVHARQSRCAERCSCARKQAERRAHAKTANLKDNNADLATQADATAGVARQRDVNACSAAHKTVQPSCWHPGDPSKLGCQPRHSACARCDTQDGRRRPCEYGRRVRQAGLGRSGSRGGDQSNDAGVAIRAGSGCRLPESADCCLGHAQMSPGPHHRPNAPTPQCQCLGSPAPLTASPAPQRPRATGTGCATAAQPAPLRSASHTAGPQARHATARSSRMPAMTVTANHARTT